MLRLLISFNIILESTLELVCLILSLPASFINYFRLRLMRLTSGMAIEYLSKTQKTREQSPTTTINEKEFLAFIKKLRDDEKQRS